MTSIVEPLAVSAYLGVLLLLVPFGFHRLLLVWRRLCFPPASRPRYTTGSPGPPGAGLPRVTVQLPLYNEANVVERAVDAACGLDYPRGRLEVQVLDDSDDETARLAARRVRAWKRRGVDVSHVRRGERTGFKAGALAEGARRARGEFFLVLDADFVPPPDLIRRLLPPFRDSGVGAVQAAWGHLNRDDSWLSRAQALFLDAHFAVEHEARRRAGLFFNFNGSAGMWRRRCLEDAGGWQHDTLTEDLDLSYRAQLAGWRFEYLDDVRVPAELPGTLRALEVQQGRWAQGGVQTALKLLPRLWRSEVRAAVKLEGTAHLLGHAVHPITLLLGVALGTLGWIRGGPALLADWVHAAAFGLATLPFLAFYGLAARLRGHDLLDTGRRVGEALALGLGLGVPLTAAVARALGRSTTPFRRTPKRGGARRRAVYGVPPPDTASWIRAALGLGLLACVARLAAAGPLGAVPFTGLFAIGYLAAAASEILHRDRERLDRGPATAG